MIDHPLYNYLNEKDYRLFYNEELSKRALVQYPPCIRFAEIELKHENESVVAKDAQNIADILKNIIQKKESPITILGPSQPPVHMIKNVCTKKIYLKAATVTELIELYKCFWI